MRTPLSVGRHYPCERCGYDLHGLAVNVHCPECGQPVARTLLKPLCRSDGQGGERESPFHRLADLCGYPVDAVLFVRDVVHRAAPAAAGHATAAAVVAAFRDRCRRYFNDPAEAVDLLGEWGLRTSDDLGRVTFALVDVGVLVAAADDRPDDFAGRFTLADLL